MTWALASTLIVIWALAVIFFRANRVWLPYYLIGSVGLAVIVIFVGRASPVQGLMETGVSLATFGVANLVGIPARIFENDANSLMVFYNCKVTTFSKNIFVWCVVPMRRAS